MLIILITGICGHQRIKLYGYEAKYNLCVLTSIHIFCKHCLYWSLNKFRKSLHNYILKTVRNKNFHKIKQTCKQLQNISYFYFWTRKMKPHFTGPHRCFQIQIYIPRAWGRAYSLSWRSAGVGSWGSGTPRGVRRSCGCGAPGWLMMLLVTCASVLDTDAWGLSTFWKKYFIHPMNKSEIIYIQ